MEQEKRGRGRPKGSLSKRTIAMREAAKILGDLPHEFLLRVMRGEPIPSQVKDAVTGEIKQVYETPDLAMRVDAAKAAAPYYAPRLQAVEVMGQIMKDSSDDALDAIIEDAARAAGLTVCLAGEGEEDEATPGARTRVRVT